MLSSRNSPKKGSNNIKGARARPERLVAGGMCGVKFYPQIVLVLVW